MPYGAQLIRVYHLSSMNKFLFLLLFLFSTLGVSAQQRAVFAELNGASNGLSLNYDSRLAPDSHWGYNVGLGYSNYTYDYYYSPLINHVSLPLRMYYLTGKGKHHFEIGAGVVPGFTYYTENLDIDEKDRQVSQTTERTQFRYYFTLNLGYRFQMTRGLLLSTGFCMNAHDSNRNYWGLAPYLSLGYAF